MEKGVQIFKYIFFSIFQNYIMFAYLVEDN